MKPDTSTSNPVHLAIVSPCSSCQNQLTVSHDGMPACPRRVAQQNIQYMQSVGIDTTGVQHLALYGTEGAAQAGNGSYLNPVYSDNLHAILIWIALLEDNGGVLDSQGNELCPNLLDPNFNTSYIQCRSLPVTTRDNEAVYFQKGAFAPKDQLEVTISARQQMTTDGSALPVLIDGFAQKVNFIFNHPRTPLSKDLCPAGT
jgi:hypothetical protein